MDIIVLIDMIYNRSDEISHFMAITISISA